jgi:hypothetical protein
MSKKDPELGIFFLPRAGTSHELCGEYNSETGHIITIDDEWVFEHYDPTAVLIHEAAHKMAHRIFKTESCAPVWWVKEHESFYEAIQKDIALIRQANWDGVPLQVAETLQEIISKCNEEKRRPQELIARIPEAAYLLSRFGYTEEKIHEILGKLFPNSFPLYLSEFIPACEKLATAYCNSDG